MLIEVVLGGDIQTVLHFKKKKITGLFCKIEFELKERLGWSWMGCVK